MHLPSVSDSNGSLGIDRDLLSDNRRRVRGLGHRWANLKERHSSGAEELRKKTESCNLTFEISKKALFESQQREFDQAITRWDSLIDSQLGNAERGTYQNSIREREQLAKERSDVKAARSAELSSFDKAKQQLKKRIEAAKEQASKVREAALVKIERESQNLDQRMRLARDWIGVKSGSPVLIHWTAHETPERAPEFAAIQSLDGVAKEFSQTKQRLFQLIDEMQRHPSLRLINYPLLIAVGALSGVATGWIAYTLASPPLIWGAAAASAAIVIPAVIALAASPLVTRTLKLLFPPIVDLEKESQFILQQGRLLIDQSFQSEVSRLDHEQKSEWQSLEKSHREKLASLESEHQQKCKSIMENALRERTEIATSRKNKMATIDQTESRDSIDLRRAQTQVQQDRNAEHARELNSMQMEFEASQHYATQRWQQGVAQVSSRIRQQWESVRTAFPPWDSEEMSRGAWPRRPDSLAWPIGSANVGASFVCEQSLEDLHQHIDRLVPVPILFDLLHHGNLILDAESGLRSTAQGVVRQLLLRAVTSLPAGSVHVTVIDPEGLGKEFSWMMHLADVDPLLVNHRAWTQPVHIANQLELAARHVEDVIQQSLRNRFRNLAEYNLQAGPMAIPYRFIVWSGFPLGLDEHSWQSLCSLLASGARCGVGLILHLAENCKWPPFVDPARLREHGLVIELRNNPPQSLLRNAGLEPSKLELAEVPNDFQVQEIMEHQLNAARNIGKRVVPFSSIAPSESQRYQASSADSLEIPIGISESGRVQSLSLGTGTAQHVLIAGKTGSGKSSLLHTMITSGALRYSPDELRMVLLDFKKGVEFQIYAERQLPHADIIGIESRREFGLSVLEYLDRILSARGEAFRGWGVQDIPSLKRKHPSVVLPRILIVIDEFQEMFVEDDKLSQQASLLMDRLVRQGRSFGMHLVLASQTLGGSYSLPRTTLAQMAVRIALQCDSSDAMLILSEDNSAAERLRHSGQGIYNDAGGRIEGNHNFQVSFFEKPEQMQWLESLPVAELTPNPTINPLGKRIVFEGHKPSRWDESNAHAAISSEPASRRSHSPWILGESVSIEPPLVRSFPPVAGRNAMIVGSDSSIVAGLLASWIRSSNTAETEAGNAAQFTILDGSNAEDTPMSKALAWAKEFSANVRVGTPRDLDSSLSDLQNDWELRNASPDAKYPTRILFISNLSRFRELRRSDEFSFSGQEGEMKPDAVLTKLLADGPALGIHVCVWVDTATTLSRWLSRNALRDIEMRILMQMSAADSNQLIDSSFANRLDRYVLLIHDDSDGKSEKFRPYELESIMEGAVKK